MSNSMGGARWQRVLVLSIVAAVFEGCVEEEPTIEMIDAGVYRTCTLDSEGDVTCSGCDKTTVHGHEVCCNYCEFPEGDYTSVSVGKFFTCAVTEEGEVVCDGSNGWGQLEVPEGRFVSVEAAFGETTYGITESGSIECWGSCHGGEGTVDVEGVFVEVTGGFDQSCGRTEEGEIQCWGGGPPVHFEGEYLQVSSGSSITCALGVDGTVVCDGCEDGYDDALCSPPDAAFQKIAVGFHHSCGLTEAGEIECWGCTGWSDSPGANEGQCDSPEGTYLDVTSGGYHSCALREDGETVCWGYSEDAS